MICLIFVELLAIISGELSLEKNEQLVSYQIIKSNTSCDIGVYLISFPRVLENYMESSFMVDFVELVWFLPKLRDWRGKWGTLTYNTM